MLALFSNVSRPVAWAVALTTAVALAGAATAACPVATPPLDAPIVDAFHIHLQQHYPMIRNDPTLSAEDRFILIGHALGRQALAVGDDPARKDAFDCLQLVLESRGFLSALAGEQVDTGFWFRTIYAAAMGMNDDRVEALTGYTAQTELPTVFGDPPVAAAPGPGDGSQSAGASAAAADAQQDVAPDFHNPTPWIEAHRDALAEQGLGAFNGPNGDRWRPERPPDYVFTVLPYPGVDCWNFDSGVWCYGTSTWAGVGVTDGDGWAMASLRNEPTCTFVTDWRETGDDGVHRFGGVMTCPDGRSSTWHVTVK